MSALLLVPAMLLDAALGEPKFLWSRIPHPAVLMGRAVAFADARLNVGDHRRLKGVVAMVGLGVLGLALGWVIHWVPDFGLLEVLVAAILLAQRSLAQHVAAVADALRLSLGDGRRAVAMIVGRDTAGMDAAAVSRAAIESAAENFSDGVIAPAFWFLLGGLPGLLLYKITNTADSMIGHRTERYEQFGWAAARFDDLLNLVPARLTALIIAVVHGRWDAGRVIIRDAALHRSPNAGWPEAAMAVVLNLSLSGPRSYAGVMTEFPYVYPEGRRDAGAYDIDASVGVIWGSWLGFLGGVVVIALFGMLV
jgi:adenosylcobinamide-phosphate synthase